MDAKENSGSITVILPGDEQSQLLVAWERKRGGPLKVRSRIAGAGDLHLHEVEALFDQVNESNRKGLKELFYFRAQLEYEGLPWRGEIWLNDSLRLGPPSRQDEVALIGPRVIIADARVSGIDQVDAAGACNVLLQELAVFLTVIGRSVRVPKSSRRAWTWTADEAGKVQCEPRYLGYSEPAPSHEMPKLGSAPPVSLKPVARPDFSLRGIRSDDFEQSLPADVLELWSRFTRLTPELTRQFLQVGRMWQLAVSLGREFATARIALMVVACEALKPPDSKFRNHNAYDVIGGLLGENVARVLQEEWLHPQELRNAHLHRGEFRGEEFAKPLMVSSFEDPTFDQASDVMFQIASAAIIEWLRREGKFEPSRLKRYGGRKRSITDHAYSVLAGAVAVGVILGYCCCLFLQRRG